MLSLPIESVSIEYLSSVWQCAKSWGSRHSPWPEGAYGLVGEGLKGPFHHGDMMGSRKGTFNLAKIWDVSPQPVTSNLCPEG